MKSYFKYFLIAACILTAACNSKQAKVEQSENEYKDAFYTTEELQEKAKEDPEFASSEEYRSQMENARMEMSKQTTNMSENDRLLLEFEVSLKALKQNTDEIKQNKNLTNDASFMKKVLAKADKVREYQQRLKNLNLNSVQKLKYEELCHQK